MRGGGKGRGREGGVVGGEFEPFDREDFYARRRRLSERIVSATKLVSFSHRVERLDTHIHAYTHTALEHSSFQHFSILSCPEEICVYTSSKSFGWLADWPERLTERE